MTRDVAAALLGVRTDADDASVKAAYRRMALQHHPDRGGDEGRFRLLTEAYGVLREEEAEEEEQDPRGWPSWVQATLEAATAKHNRGTLKTVFGADRAAAVVAAAEAFLQAPSLIEKTSTKKRKKT